MTEKEIIEKLKKPTLAQPFGLLPESQQDILGTAGKANCLYYRGSWEQPVRGRFADDTTYILKPDYQPEPEYEDINIVGYGLYLGAYGGLGSILPHHFNHLHILTALPSFVGFFRLDNRNRVRPDCVATKIREGHKVVARFVKE
jgi:hypothetical protein